MKRKANLLTLMMCGLMLFAAIPSQADNDRRDHQRPAWRNKHDNNSVEKNRDRNTVTCGDDKNCTETVIKNKPEYLSPKKKHTKDVREKAPHKKEINKKILRQDDAQQQIQGQHKKIWQTPLRPEKHRPQQVRKEKARPDSRQTEESQPAIPRPVTGTTRNERDKRDHDRPATNRITPETRHVTVNPGKPATRARRHQHRITYVDQIRHDHRYIRGPWYNTRYISPVQIRRYKTGYRLPVLPRTHVRIMFGGLPYFYYSGIFYRPHGTGYIVVTAPVGALVRTLPFGFIAFTIGLSTYYYVNDDYYVWDEDREAYRVVAKPPGAAEAIEQATAGRLVAYPNNGQSEEQQAQDRYECHRWAVKESGIDPTLEEQEFDAKDRDVYQRAIAACLVGRGYTVK